MANPIKFFRGLEANRSAQTPAVATPLWTTDGKKLYIGDGATAGGIGVSMDGHTHDVLKYNGTDTKATAVNGGIDVTGAVTSDGMFVTANDSRQIDFVMNDTVADAGYTGILFDYNVSGADAVTVNRSHYGFRLLTNSSATGGDTTNEHRLYGTYLDVNVGGDSDLVYGMYNRVQATHTTGTITTARAAYNYVLANHGAGSAITNARATQTLAYAKGAGTVTLLESSRFHSQVQATAGAVTESSAIWAKVEVLGSTLGTAKVVTAEFDGGGGATTTSYLYHGAYSGTLPTTAWGVYIADDVPNYFAGNLIIDQAAGAVNALFDHTDYHSILRTESVTTQVLQSAHDDPNYSPRLRYTRTRGTLTTPTTVVDEDKIMNFTTQCFDGTAMINNTGGIAMFVDGTVSTGIIPTRIDFEVMNTAGSKYAALTIGSEGDVTATGSLTVGGVTTAWLDNTDAHTVKLASSEIAVGLAFYTDSTTLRGEVTSDSGGNFGLKNADGDFQIFTNATTSYLRYDNVTKLNTTAAGGTLTGTWNATTDLTVGGTSVSLDGHDHSNYMRLDQSNTQDFIVPNAWDLYYNKDYYFSISPTTSTETGSFWVSAVHISGPVVTESAVNKYPRTAHYWSFTNSADPTDLTYNMETGHSGGLTTHIQLESNNTGNITLKSAGSVLLQEAGATKLNTTTAGGTLTGTWNATTDLTVGGTSVSLSGHTHTFASLTSKPTTISGYGITDGVQEGDTVTLTGDVTGTADFDANGDVSITTVVVGDATHTHSDYISKTDTSAQTIVSNFTMNPSGTPTLTIGSSAASGVDAVLSIEGARTGSTNDITAIHFVNDTSSAYDMAKIVAKDPQADHLQGDGELIFRTSNNGSLSQALLLDENQDALFSGDVTVSGDFVVNGTTTTINAATLEVEDKNIELGAVTTPSDITATGGGITLLAGADVDKTFKWESTYSAWNSSEQLRAPSFKSTTTTGIVIDNTAENVGSIYPSSDVAGASLYITRNGTSGVDIEITDTGNINLADVTGGTVSAGGNRVLTTNDDPVYNDGTDAHVTINTADSDFTVNDSNNTSYTNYIWRDHSANALYLGAGSDDVVTLRSQLDMNSWDIINGSDITITGDIVVGKPVDFWSGLYIDVGTSGWISSGGSYRTTIGNNGYRNSSGGYTYMGSNGNTTTASVIEFDHTAFYYRAGTAATTQLPEVLTVLSGTAAATLKGTSPQLVFNDTDGETSRLVQAGPDLFIQAPAVTSGDVLFTGYNAVDMVGDVYIKKNGSTSRVLTTADEGTGNGLDAGSLQGYVLSTSGDRWGVIPPVLTDGVMDIGRFIDFHETDASVAGYDARITSTSGTLIASGAFQATAGITCTTVTATSDGPHVFGTGLGAIILAPDGGVYEDPMFSIRTSGGGAHSGIRLDMDDDWGANNDYAMRIRLSDAPQTHDDAATKFLVRADGKTYLNYGDTDTITEDPWLAVNGDIHTTGVLYATNTFDINGSGGSGQQNGLYIADLGGVAGTTLNPLYSSAICAQIGNDRSIAVTVNADGYLYGFRSHSTVATYTWESKVKYADEVEVTSGNSGDTTCFVPFVTDTTTGYKQLWEDESLTYDNTNNILTCANFAGNATTATTATNADLVDIDNDDTGDTNCPIVFTATSTTGYKKLYEDSAVYIDNTANKIYASGFVGNITSSTAIINGDLYINDDSPQIFMTESGAGSDGIWSIVVDGDSWSIRKDNTSPYPMYVTTDGGGVPEFVHFFAAKATIDTAGNFSAVTKSFVIDHPTKPNKTLRHGSLEGPENGVYVRGKLTDSNTILLPDYWKDLVDEDSITVQLTAIGTAQNLRVMSVDIEKIVVKGSYKINCFYMVNAERKDVDKMIVEGDKK